MAFAQLGLNPLVVKAVEASGYTEPTAVQIQAIPATLEGSDLLVSSQTGSGKTAAFMLPCLHRLDQPSALPGRGPRVLVLTPTRELAQQVTRAAETYGKFLKRLRVVAAVGGAPLHVQAKLLSQPVDIVVATPGRLIDHLERGRIDFSRLETLILDEADRMLDMGFIDDIEAIIARCPSHAPDAAVLGHAGRRRRPPRPARDEERPPHRDRDGAGTQGEDRAAHPFRRRLLAQVAPARPPAARRRALAGGGVHLDQEIRRRPRRAAARRRLLRRGAAWRHEPARPQPHPAGAAPGPHPRAGGDRRRRPRHRRARHQPRHQLRPAAPGRGLRAPHRPHRPRRARPASPSAWRRTSRSGRSATSSATPHKPSTSASSPASSRRRARRAQRASATSAAQPHRVLPAATARAPATAPRAASATARRGSATGKPPSAKNSRPSVKKPATATAKGRVPAATSATRPQAPSAAPTAATEKTPRPLPGAG